MTSAGPLCWRGEPHELGLEFGCVHRSGWCPADLQLSAKPEPWFPRWEERMPW